MLHTSKHGQAHTIQIQIVRAHAPDLTMASNQVTSFRNEGRVMTSDAEGVGLHK